MITNKMCLLISVVLLMAVISWAPFLWNFRETGGLHWLLIRLPMGFVLIVSAMLFLYSINDQKPDGK